MAKAHHSSVDVAAAVEAAHGYLADHIRSLTPTDISTRRVAAFLDLLECGDLSFEDLHHKAAKGDPDASYVLRLEVRQAIKELPYPSLPQPVLTFLFDLLTEEPPRQRKRGRDAFGNLDRDQTVIGAIKMMVDLGFDPIRNPATADKGHRHSGCSIVSSALKKLNINLGERRLEQIWKCKSLQGPLGLPDDPALPESITDPFREPDEFFGYHWCAYPEPLSYPNK